MSAAPFNTAVVRDLITQFFNEALAAGDLEAATAAL
jgi:hypothetical protein